MRHCVSDHANDFHTFVLRRMQMAQRVSPRATGIHFRFQSDAMTFENTTSKSPLAERPSRHSHIYSVLGQWIATRGDREYI